MSTPASDGALLTIDALEIGHGGRALVPPISATLRRGERWALIGRNGSGKTTLLRTLLGLHPGVDGRLVRAPDANIGYVPQRESLDPAVPMRVIDVVRGGVDRGWRFALPALAWRARERVARAMDEGDCAALRSRQYATLSEGQKQRVLIARVLAGEPDLLVLDEPTSAMDRDAERAAFDALERAAAARSLGLLVVSHNLRLVAERATHVLMLAPGVVVAGPIEVVAHDPQLVEQYGTMFQEGAPC